MIPAVVEIDLASLHGHWAPCSYLGPEPDRVIQQLLPETRPQCVIGCRCEGDKGNRL